MRIVLRIEDLDTPRVKPGVIDSTVRTLEALGMDWDEGPLIQSRDLEPYVRAMERLAAGGLAYPCELTRSQIEAAASAPNEGDHEVRFDASLRPAAAGRAVAFDSRETNWRFICPDGAVAFEDEFTGAQAIDPSRSVGDFVVWTKRACPSYQLAVVVDDARQGITDVVRGSDLLDSASRQILLYRALGLRAPRFLHLPLVRGSDGRRLAKRHGDTRIEAYLKRGVAVERIIALLGRWCGMGEVQELSARGFMERLNLTTIPREDITFTQEDDAWLLHG